MRRCIRLRKALRNCFADAIQKYSQVSAVIKGFAEALDLEKYYDIYDISDLDSADASQGYKESDFEDVESLRTLKIVAARFHTIRKMFLCSLLALEANGEKSDFLRWTTAVEGLRELNEATKDCYERTNAILSEEECTSSNGRRLAMCVPLTRHQLSPRSRLPKCPSRPAARDGALSCGSSTRSPQVSEVSRRN